MAYDWNSFYGTFAQVSGAFLGIILAFLISKILSIENVVKEIFQDHITYLDEFVKLKERAKKHDFDDANYDILYDGMNKLETLFMLGELSPIEIVKSLYSRFDLFRNDDAVYATFLRLKKHLHRGHAYLKLKGGTNDKVILGYRLREQAKTLADKIDANIRKCYFEKEQFKSMERILLILLFAFPLLVVYPLHFLPIPDKVVPRVEFSLSAVGNYLFTLRGVYISLLVLTGNGIIGYFFIKTRAMEKQIERIVNLSIEQNMTLEGISPYFEEFKRIPTVKTPSQI